MFVLLEHVGKIPLCIPHARCVRQKLQQMRRRSLRCLFATNVSRQRRNTRHRHGKLCGFPIQNCAMHFTRVKGVSIMLKYVTHTMCKAFFNKFDMFPCSKMTLHNVSCRHWLQRDASCDWHMFSVDRARPTGKFDISVLWNQLRHHYGVVERLNIHHLSLRMDLQRTFAMKWKVLHCEKCVLWWDIFICKLQI